jgi:hypothetical protein
MNTFRIFQLSAAVFFCSQIYAVKVFGNEDQSASLSKSRALAVQAGGAESSSAESSDTDARAANRAQGKLKGNVRREYVLTFSELRDIGVTLQQIQEEAVHIYFEAARKDVPLNDDPKLVEPKSIPVAGLRIDRTCEPVRREWLLFFIGEMEPFIHFLNDGVAQVENEETKLVMPNLEKEAANKLWAEWAEGIQDLNKELDNMNELLSSEKIENKALADQAVAIFNSCQKLEDVRVKVHTVIQESEPK